MQLSNAPSKIVEPFGVNAAPSGGYGGKRTIPVPSQTGITPGAASYNDGFPPLTMTPIPGGVVMSGLDMNGILFDATAIDNWASVGGGWKFDSVFATAIGGYPKGARVLNAAGSDYWINQTDNNSINPDTGSVPTGWIPSRATASVYASAQQTLLNGNAKVLYDTVEFDYYGLWNSGSKYFKALWPGKYRFSGSTYLPAPAGQNFAAEIWKNGAIAKRLTEFPQVSNTDLTLSFGAILSLAVGDYVEAYLNPSQSNVSAGQVGSNLAFVYSQIEYLGL